MNAIGVPIMNDLIKLLLLTSPMTLWALNGITNLILNNCADFETHTDIMAIISRILYVSTFFALYLVLMFFSWIAIVKYNI